MKQTKFLLYFLLSFLSSFLSLSAFGRDEGISVIDPDRIVKIQIPCRTFNSDTKIVDIEVLDVLDVLADSVKLAFDELYENNFPIYAVMGYESRNIVNGTKPSLHAYGAAIDINEMIILCNGAQRA